MVMKADVSKSRAGFFEKASNSNSLASSASGSVRLTQVGSVRACAMCRSASRNGGCGDGNPLPKLMVPHGVGSVPPGEENTAFPPNITTIFSPQI